MIKPLEVIWLAIAYREVVCVLHEGRRFAWDAVFVLSSGLLDKQHKVRRRRSGVEEGVASATCVYINR